MKFGGLFSGIGGFALGFQRAGFEIVWQVEIDEWSQDKLSNNFRHAERHGDIRSVGAHNLEPVDVICGGFPCQPFSHAGKRAGTEDDRYLWPEMLRVIDELRPTWVVGENVDGLRSMAFNPGKPRVESRSLVRTPESDTLDKVLSFEEEMLLEAICQDLENISYEVIPFVIPACGVDAWHRRNRIWIIAHNEGERCGETRRYSERPAQWAASSSKILGPLTHPDRQSLAVRCDERGNDAEEFQAAERGTDHVSDAQGRRRDNGDDRKDIRAPDREEYSPENTASCSISEPCIWPPEPEMVRVLHGVPYRMVEPEIKGLGNAVVPQIPELFGHFIMQIEQQKQQLNEAA